MQKAVESGGDNGNLVRGSKNQAIIINESNCFTKRIRTRPRELKLLIDRHKLNCLSEFFGHPVPCPICFRLVLPRRRLFLKE